MKATTLLLFALVDSVASSLLTPAYYGHAGLQHVHAATARTSTLEMMGRKGRPKMPSSGMQGAYASGAGQAPPPLPQDGMPMFYLYCRSKAGMPWYPVSAMKGDGQSKGLIQAWLNSPFAKGVFKDRLDEGMAKSIFDSERRLANLAVEQYAQLKDSKSRLQWGFKILDKDLEAKEAAGEIEKQKIIPVNKSMINTGLLQNAQTAASNLLNGGGGGEGGEGGKAGGDAAEAAKKAAGDAFGAAKKAADGLFGGK